MNKKQIKSVVESLYPNLIQAINTSLEAIPVEERKEMARLILNTLPDMADVDYVNDRVCINLSEHTDYVIDSICEPSRVKLRNTAAN